jgi:hypothetical protein
MRLSVLALVAVVLAGCGSKTIYTEANLPIADEMSFRRLRQEYHVAQMTGDDLLMRSVWADDAEFTPVGESAIIGGDAIADAFRRDPNFGQHLVLTSESSWTVSLLGNRAEFGFETISIDVGADEPGTTNLAIAGAQDPSVEIVGHTHCTGIAFREENGLWVFHELVVESGPLPRVPARLSGVTMAGRSLADFDAPIGDELGFRRMREDFHGATVQGDYDLLHSVWDVDAVFTTGGGAKYVGADAITDFMSSGSGFGTLLMLIPESSSTIVLQGDVAQYGFECIWVDVGGTDAMSTELCDADGSQNPAVEIIRHTNSTGIAVRVAPGRWQFKEFNGGGGPLPGAAE